MVSVMKTQIMDVTLRDGSYAINYQFSEQDTKCIGVALENAGIRYVEIGHGMGLNASSYKNGLALCTDEEYLAAAQGAYRKCTYGMFCIPGVARVEDLDLLKKYGAGFVRVGCNIDKIRTSEPYVRRAKELGLMVAANYMKSYTATEEEFAQCVELSRSYGADIIYVVDSAGCMLPEDVKKYFDIIKQFGLKAGFHGHNNQQLAFSNTIQAIINHVDYLDGSVSGMGRGAGNCTTELLLSFLKNPKYDLRPVLDAIQELFLPLRDKYEWGYIIPQMITGMLNRHPQDAIAIRKTEDKDNYRKFYDHMMND